MFDRLTKALLLMMLVIGSIALGEHMAGSGIMGAAVMVGFLPAAAGFWIAKRDPVDSRFLVRVFLWALLARWALAFLIYSYHLQDFLGGDAGTYDAFGRSLAEAWTSSAPTPAFPFTKTAVSGWGMYYYVAAVYFLIGNNSFALQLLNGALGALTCLITYRIATLVYPSQRVARTAVLLTAFSPSLVLWSSQMMRDGPIVFCLALCTYYTLRLRERLELRWIAGLALTLFALFALRHYVAYIVFAAIAGTLILGHRRFTPLRVMQGAALVILIGLALAYYGGSSVAEKALNIKSIQSARVWSAQAANSGYGGDVDITDPQAALAFLPVGAAYFLFAPFPWMLTNLRQLITLPELIVWWALTPALIRGFWRSTRDRLRESLVISVFTIGLTIVYALYQTNVGTAYRHRAQLYVFFAVFISIGLELKVRQKIETKRRRIAVQPTLAMESPP